jgi:hypothetical protein
MMHLNRIVKVLNSNAIPLVCSLNKDYVEVDQIVYIRHAIIILDSFPLIPSQSIRLSFFAAAISRP